MASWGERYAPQVRFSVPSCPVPFCSVLIVVLFVAWVALSCSESELNWLCGCDLEQLAYGAYGAGMCENVKSGSLYLHQQAEWIYIKVNPHQHVCMQLWFLRHHHHHWHHWHHNHHDDDSSLIRSWTKQGFPTEQMNHQPTVSCLFFHSFSLIGATSIAVIFVFTIFCNFITKNCVFRDVLHVLWMISEWSLSALKGESIRRSKVIRRISENIFTLLR